MRPLPALSPIAWEIDYVLRAGALEEVLAHG
jgi:hypothetical protein